MKGDAEEGFERAQGFYRSRGELTETDSGHLLGTDGEEDECEGLMGAVDDAAALDLGDERLGDAAADVFGHARLGVVGPL